MKRIYRNGKSADEVKAIFERRYEEAGSPIKMRRVIRFLKKTSIIKTISRLGSGSALDIGCGLGSWTEGLRRVGCQAQGIDLSENAVSHAELAFPLCSFISGDVLDFSDSKFDVLFMRGLSFYNQPFFEAGTPSEKLVEVTDKLLSLGKEGGLFVFVCYTKRLRIPGLSPKGNMFYHTIKEVKSFFDLFRKSKVYFLGSYLVCEFII